MVILHKVSLVDIKLPKVAQYTNVHDVAGAFSLQVYDPYFFPDQVKYFISMKYTHGLSALGGINMEDGRTVILFYKEPSASFSRNEAIEVVEES